MELVCAACGTGVGVCSIDHHFGVNIYHWVARGRNNYENAKRNLRSKLSKMSYAKSKSRVLTVLNTMTVGVDSIVKYWINAIGREEKK